MERTCPERSRGGCHWSSRSFAIDDKSARLSERALAWSSTVERVLECGLTGCSVFAHPQEQWILDAGSDGAASCCFWQQVGATDGTTSCGPGRRSKDRQQPGDCWEAQTHRTDPDVALSAVPGQSTEANRQTGAAINKTNM
ncbi:MAG TPA: hypothetical protein PKD54_03995 [Pirellulaceae bacterium]|nr:hypothetical protein [Pirellulaceae bacterium]